MIDHDDTTHFGFRKIPIAEKAGRVAEVFQSVANKYDVMNDVMSLGTHRLFKQIAIEYTAARQGHIILDHAGGTGDLAIKLSKVVGQTGHVILCDINDAMLTQGRDRLLDDGINGNVSYIQADGEQLPFRSSQFNAITIGFGLRNFTNKQFALDACLQALKPGGKLVVLEFSTPENPVVRKLYGEFSNLWPRLGEIITGDKDSYQYLVESIKMHPPQQELCSMMEATGFLSVQYHNLLNGVVAIHVGSKGTTDETD
jgi:demethylmenaquinone methyltransferase/2-methoxy-6-polyprenyl-1,4-benzoquinol methylase